MLVNAIGSNPRLIYVKDFRLVLVQLIEPKTCLRGMQAKSS